MHVATHHVQDVLLGMLRRAKMHPIGDVGQRQSKKSLGEALDVHFVHGVYTLLHQTHVLVSAK